MFIIIQILYAHAHEIYYQNVYRYVMKIHLGRG